MWEDILSAIVAGTGAKLQYDAQNDALRRQQQAIAAAQAQQASLQQQRQGQVLEMARQFTPEAAAQQLEQAIAPQQQRLEGVAQQAATQSATAPAPVGASARYDTSRAQRSAEELQRAMVEAGLAARAGGGQRLMFEQGMKQAQGASDLDTISSAMLHASRASQNQINRAGQVDPRRLLVSGALLQVPSILSGRLGKGGGLTGLGG